jgi:hypothetical protein
LKPPSLESGASKVSRKETENGWIYHVGDDASEALKDAVDRANEDLVSMREELQEEYQHSPKDYAENLKKKEEELEQKQRKQFDAIDQTPGQGFGQGGLIEGENDGPKQGQSPDIDEDEEEIDRRYSAGLQAKFDENFLVGERKKRFPGHKPVTKYFDKDGTTELLRRKDNKFTFSGKDANGNPLGAVNREHVRLSIEALNEDGHTKVKVTGSQELRRIGWQEARLAGMKCEGFTPKPEDIAKLADLANERGVALPQECIDAGHKAKNKNSIGKDSISIGKDSEEKDSISIDEPSKNKKRAREDEDLPDDRPEKEQKFSSLDLAYTIECNDELDPPFQVSGNAPPQVRDLVLKANAEVESIKRSNKVDIEQKNSMEQCRINTMTALMEIKGAHMLEVRSDDQLMRQGVLKSAKDGETLAKVVKVTDDGPAYAVLTGGAGPKSEPKIIRLSAAQAQGMTVGLKLDSTRPIVSNTLPSPTQGRSAGRGRGGAP